MPTKDYSDRIAQEIKAYREIENTHALPDIYHVWAAEILLPRMQNVIATGSNVLFYVNIISEKCNLSTAQIQIISIGSGDGFLEVEIARELLARDHRNFHIQCLELSPDLISRATDKISNANVANYVGVVQVDINTWAPESAASIEVFIANQFLHHVVHLEFLFDQIHEALKLDGVFLTTDMIGRNGHMRWFEAELILKVIWNCLPMKYKYNHQLGQMDEDFNNWDCSNEGFEGIRAQDILPLLLGRFEFQTFLAYGNITDLFLDRAYGHNFDPNEPGDLAFIYQLSRLNDLLIDSGVIKPTMMFASMTKEQSVLSCFRHWTPEFCLRDPSHERIKLQSRHSQEVNKELVNWISEIDQNDVDLDGITRDLASLESTCKIILTKSTEQGKSLESSLIGKVKEYFLR